MRPRILFALLAGFLAATSLAGPAQASWQKKYVVAGVEGDDMLKMRAGPGTGYVVILGLPNGTLVQIESCQQIGGTRWCKVFLDKAPAYAGYVSFTYLREK